MKRRFLLEMEVDWDEEILEDMHPDSILEDAIIDLYNGVSIRIITETTHDGEKTIRSRG